METIIPHLSKIRQSQRGGYDRGGGTHNNTHREQICKNHLKKLLQNLFSEGNNNYKLGGIDH